MSDSRLVRALQNQREPGSRRMVPMADSSGEASTIEGFLLVLGAGELAVDINFPVKFTERPNVQCTGELVPGQTLTIGEFPTLSVLIGRFRVVEHNEFTYWVGAALIVVTTGSAGLEIRLHWRANGKALDLGADVSETGTLEEPHV